MQRAASNNHHISTFTIAFIVAMTCLAGTCRAATETTDSQELRNRARQEALERERQQQAPNVNLQSGVPQAGALQLPSTETPCFTVNDFVLEVPDGVTPAARRYGASKLPLDTFRFAQDFLEQYKGRCIGREGINILVRGVTAKILERGYSTTRIGIPEQDMTSGTLKLTLVPGIIHELRFAEPGTEGTWKNAFPTSAGKLLNLRDLEQGLEQMKRVASQDVDMQIVPSARLGESDVVITVKRIKPWKITTSLDDSGLPSTGQYQAGVNFAMDNPLGLSDIFNLGYTHDADGSESNHGTHGRNYYYSIPSGNFTFTTTGSENLYHQQVTGSVSSFTSSGVSRNVDLKTEYMLYRDQARKESLEFRTGKYFSQSFLNGTPIDVQHRNNSFAEVGWIHKHYLGAAQLDGTLAYRQGMPWFGAQSDSSGAQFGGPTYYYKLETIDVTLSVPFQMSGMPMRYSGTLRLQDSSSVLFPTEYVAIGGRYTVRGFDGNTTLGSERGGYLREDLQIPLAQTGHTFYWGLDAGVVAGPNTANLQGTRLVGTVIGFKGSPFKGGYYDVFLGGPLAQPVNFPNRWPVMGFTFNLQV